MTQPLLSSSHLAENHRERDPAQAVWAEVSGAGNGVQKAVLQTRQGGAPRAVTGAVLPDHPAAHPELTRCLLQATAACPKNYSISAAVQPPEPSTFHTQKRGTQHCRHPTSCCVTQHRMKKCCSLMNTGQQMPQHSGIKQIQTSSVTPRQDLL